MHKETVIENISKGEKSQEFRYLSKKNWFQPFKEKKVLDLGCGNGVYTKLLTRLDIKPIAFDINRNSLELAKNYVGKIDINTCLGNGIDLPFENSTFDLVICIETLSHIPRKDHIQAFEEIGRVIKKDGILITSVHNHTRFALQRLVRMRKPLLTYETPGLTIYPFTKTEFKKNLTQVGFVVDNRFSFLNFYNSVHQRYPKFFRLLIMVENLLSKIPIVKYMSITILTKAVKT